MNLNKCVAARRVTAGESVEKRVHARDIINEATKHVYKIFTT